MGAVGRCPAMPPGGRLLMGPMQSISSGFRRTFVFSGRACRSEFWWFFPIGIAMPICAATLGTFVGSSYWAISLVAFVCATPLFACGARRLQDTGENGLHAVVPWFYFFGSTTLVYLMVQIGAYAGEGIDEAGSPAGFFLALWFGAGLLALLLVSLFFAMSFLALITPAFGQCLVPGQRGSNRFGPNPLERNL